MSDIAKHPHKSLSIKSYVKATELSTIKMVANNEKIYSRVIHDGRVKNWVGFAWVDEGKATDKDYENYPMVIK